MVYCSADGWQLKLGTLLLAGGINGLHRVVSPITGVAARATPKHFRSSEEPELLWSTLLITTAINTSKQHSCCSYTLSNCNPSITSSSQSTTNFATMLPCTRLAIRQVAGPRGLASGLAASSRTASTWASVQQGPPVCNSEDLN